MIRLLSLGRIKRAFFVLMVLLTLGGAVHGLANQDLPQNIKIIQVGGNNDFAPYEFIDAKGRASGYTVELMQAVLRQVGLEAEITLGPWQEMLKKLEDRQIDALTGLLYSEERGQRFDFSVPHTIISYAIFVRKGAPYNSIEALKNKEAVVVQDVYAHEWLKSNQFTSNVIMVQTPGEVLRQLSSGQHDFAVLPQLHGLELMRRMKLSNLETIGPPVLSQKFCFAVAAGHADLLAKLNEGLMLLQKSGDYDRLFLKWFSLYEQKTRYWRVGSRIGLVLLALMLLVIAWNLTLKKAVARKTIAVQKSRTLLSQIVEGMPMPTFVVDRANHLTHWNKACEVLTGASASQVLGTAGHNQFFYAEKRLPISQLVLEESAGSTLFTCTASRLVEGACELEFHFQREGRPSKWLYGTAATLRTPEGEVIGAIESWQDLTEYKRMEAQLIQSQKMEAIGTLAGGISHDFSNMLTAIMANTELARRASKSNSQAMDALQKVLDVCDHAKRLIRRILIFSRQSEVEIKPARIDALVNEAIDLIRATLPSAMKVERDIQSQALVSVDATQLHQVLMNLCANAAHAMGGRRGTLTIRLASLNLESEPLPEELSPERGPYVKISVSDTGHGIPEEIINRIFDPFFTTKKRGEGTGMGLSVSHGIIKRFGGAITVASRVGHGATFNIFLPAIQSDAELVPFAIEQMPKGKEHLLVVGHNAAPLTETLPKLERLGYRVTVRKNAQEAIELLQAQTEEINLIIAAGPPAEYMPTDELRAIKKVGPAIPIILAAGYGVDLEQSLAYQIGVEAVIREPIIVGELAGLLRKLLGQEEKEALIGAYNSK